MCYPLLVLLLAGQVPDDPQEALQVAIATLADQERQLTTVATEYRVTATHPSIPDGLRVNNTVRELRRGTDFRIDDYTKQWTSRPEDLLEGDEKLTFNGRIHASHFPAHKSGSMSSKGGDRGSYFHRVLGVPVEYPGLSDFLNAQVKTGRTSWITVDGERLLHLEWGDLTAGKFSIDLSPRHHWQPRRYLVEADLTGVPHAGGYTSNSVDRVVREYLEEDGFVVPKVVQSDYLMTNQNGRTEVRSAATFELLSLTPNPPVSDADFVMDFPDGTKVFDSDRRVRYIVGQPGSEESVRVVEAGSVDGTPQHHWADGRLWLMASVLFSGVGAWLYWRNTRSA